MEKYSYKYVSEKNYTIPNNFNHTHGVIAMKDLFNMMAGTSTGSILASALSYPN
jgi:patatin-like phospholipase/acyl hydrolase